MSKNELITRLEAEFVERYGPVLTGAEVQILLVQILWRIPKIRCAQDHANPTVHD